jgi:hypothetical protein
MRPPTLTPPPSFPGAAPKPYRPDSKGEANIRSSRWVQIGLTVALILVALWLFRSCGEDVPDDVTVVAAGDMICDPKDPAMTDGLPNGDDCRFQEVSDMAMELKPYALLGLGDYVYEVPKAETFNTLYDKSWGRLRDRTLPALGNQELKVHEANTFRDYFGDRSGPETGYWSTQVGRWHVVVLNSNCTVVIGACSEGSPQQEWLANDLAKNPNQCTLALMHHPRWSTGLAGPDGRTQDLYQTMYDNGVDLVLSGHEADYERFGRLDPAGKSDPAGVRQFVVGTGGQAVYAPEEGVAPWRNKGNLIASEYRQTEFHGFLQLDLHPDGYEWAYHALNSDERVLDSGAEQCS